MTNKEASEKIFTYLRINHFEPININYKNSYFVFDMGENSVVYFNIKGLHNWQFGMWVDTNEDNNGDEKIPAVQFFCQHTLNIDKFKPSRSFFLQEFKLSEVKSNNPWLYPLLPMLKTIKNHPFVSFAMDGYGSQYYECHIDIDMCCDCFDKMMSEYIEPKLKFKDSAIMDYEDFVGKHYST